MSRATAVTEKRDRAAIEVATPVRPCGTLLLLVRPDAPGQLRKRHIPHLNRVTRPEFEFKADF